MCRMVCKLWITSFLTFSYFLKYMRRTKFPKTTTQKWPRIQYRGGLRPTE